MENKRKLEQLSYLLKEALQDSYWHQAVSSNNFAPLIEKLHTIQKMNLTDAPEVQSFEHRLQEWQEAHQYILEQIKEINLLFKAENYEKILEILDSFSSLPNIPPSGRVWRSIQIDDYEKILKIMDPQFRLWNVQVNSSESAGRTSLKYIVTQYHQTLVIWEIWDKVCQEGMDLVSDILKAVEIDEIGSTPIKIRQHNWQNLNDKLKQVVNLLENEPKENKEIVSTSYSIKVRQIQMEGQLRLKIAKAWLHTSETNLSIFDQALSRKEFPSAEEFIKVRQKDWGSVEKLLLQARQAESMSDKEKEFIDFYMQVLKRERETDNKKSTISNDQNRKLKYKISVAYPKLLSKRFSTIFLVHLYLPEARNKVLKMLNTRFKSQERIELIQNSKTEPNKIISIRLQSPDILFSDIVTLKLNDDIHTITFTAKTKDNCFPGVHPVILSLIDAASNTETFSMVLNVEVRDFAFDHVSRPLLSQSISALLGTGSLIMYVLTLLGQIDTTFGLASGTVAAALASGIFARLQSLYKHPKNVIME